MLPRRVDARLTALERGCDRIWSQIDHLAARRALLARGSSASHPEIERLDSVIAALRERSDRLRRHLRDDARRQARTRRAH